MFRRQKLSEAQVYETLKTVKYPGYTRDIVSFGLVKSVQVHGQDVNVVVQMTTNQQDVAAKIQQATEEHCVPSRGLGQCRWKYASKTRGQQRSHTQHQAAPMWHLSRCENIAVASGKGGGEEYRRDQPRCGTEYGRVAYGTLLDADIYGPSIPLMMGVHDRPQVTTTNRILPFFNHGVKMQSLGFSWERILL